MTARHKYVHKPVIQQLSSETKTKPAAAARAETSQLPRWVNGLPIQAKLTINQPGDEYEREADRVAEQVMRMPAGSEAGRVQRCACGGVAGPDGECAACKAKRLGLQRKGDGIGESDAPPSVHETLNRSGQPLDMETRGFMESRVGQDFSGVRVHTDGQAAKSAQDVNAKAYTVGQDVVFGVSEYMPGTEAGNKLIAHELMHTVQQTGRVGTMSRLFRKKNKPPALWYQEVVDRLKVAEKNEFIPLEGPMLRKFMALVKALDEEDAAVVPKLLADFVSGDAYSLPPLFPSDSIARELIARMLLLGLKDESEQFRAWHLHQPGRTLIKSTSRKEFSDEVYLWENVLERLTGRIPTNEPDAAVKVLDGLMILFDQLRGEAVGLDKDALEADRKRRSFNKGIGLDTYELRPDLTISLYFAHLLELLRQTFAGIQIAYQVVFDQAMADLGAGRGGKYLQVAKNELQKLVGLVEPADPLKLVGGVTLPITRSVFEKGGGRHLDIFLKDKAAEKRSVKIDFYDIEMPESLAMEKQLDFGRILAIRRQQIQVMERLYGLEKDEKGQLTGETKENAAAIAKLGKGGLRLNSDDDWRKFVLEKFEIHRITSGNAEALTVVINLLKTYLVAFTTHTPYNVEDFGDNLLTKTFPRALTGQLVHDCGVYALRIAYILSLLREHPRLKLRFRYIVLPVHIGLIITGKDLPLYIAHNDQFRIYSPTDMASIEAVWRSTDEQGEPRKRSGKDETGQMLGELAGDEFIPGANLPFQILDVPHLKGSPASMKQTLWKFYTKKSQLNLFGPTTRDKKSPHFQFHLHYLKMMEMVKVHFNTRVIPFWNVKAHNTWLDQGTILIQLWEQLQSTKNSQEKSKALQQYNENAQSYVNIITGALQEVQDAFNPITVVQIENSQILRDQPKVIARGIPITHSERVEAVFTNLIGRPGQWWERMVYDHLKEIQKPQQKPDAPFASKKDLLEPIE